MTSWWRWVLLAIFILGFLVYSLTASTVPVAAPSPSNQGARPDSPDGLVRVLTTYGGLGDGHSPRTNFVRS
jgi:predicted MFS family arabinose efflux permease